MQATEMSETCTLTEFQEHLEEHINRVARTRQPMFVASNGAPDVVLLDVESYQQMLETIDRAETIEGIRQGLESMRQGKGRPAHEFFGRDAAEVQHPGKAMSYRVIIEEPAQAEIEDALRWMAQHSPEAAALWHFDLTEAIESFQNSPRRCPLAYENEEFDEEIRHLIFGK